MKYLIALIFLALPAYLIRFGIFGIPTTLLEILIYVVFAIGLFNIKNAVKIEKKYLWPIGLFLVAGLISIFVAPDKTVALGQFKALFIDPILVFWLIVSYLKISDIKWPILGLAGSSFIVSAYSITQKILGNVTIDSRVVGIFGYSPNYVALFLAPITVLMLVSAWQFWRTNKFLAFSFQLLALLNIVALYLSGSRGGLLALVVGLAFYLILRYWSYINEKLWLKICIGLVVVVSIFAAVLVFRPNFSLNPAVGGRVSSSNNIRYEIWRTSIELGLRQPVLGVGLGNYQNAFSQLTQDRVNFPEYISPWALSSHNIFLMFWLTTGLLGLVAFAWLLINFCQVGCKYVDKPVAIILLSVMAVILAQGLVDTPYFKNDLSQLFWFLIGFMILLRKE